MKPKFQTIDEQLYYGTDGTDVLTGTAGDDAFIFSGHGADGRPRFGVTDRVDGGAGNDQLGLQFDARTLLEFNADTMKNIETIVLLSAADKRFGYDADTTTMRFRLHEDNVAPSATLTINANNLGRFDFANVYFNQADSSLFYIGGHGTDYVTGGEQDDAFFFGAGAFRNTDVYQQALPDVLFGGGGNDQLGLQGNYTLTFGGLQTSTMSGVESIVLLGHRDTRFGGSAATPFQYDITFAAGYDGGSAQLVNANTLGADETLRFDASALNGPAITVYGGAGDDRITGGQYEDRLYGGAGNDWISIAAGGNDVVQGGAGYDTVFAGRELNEHDLVDFGTGGGELVLEGIYEMRFDGGRTGARVTGFDTLTLRHWAEADQPGPYKYPTSYSIKLGGDRSLEDPETAGTTAMWVDARDLRAGDYASIDAYYYGSGLTYVGGAGYDFVVGTAYNDLFRFAVDRFGADDDLRGGAGADRLSLSGGGTVLIDAAKLRDVETVELRSGWVDGSNAPHGYRLTVGAQAPAGLARIDASDLRAGEAVVFENRSASRFEVQGGAGDDRYIGGAGNEFIYGGAGNDFFDLSAGGADSVGGEAGDDGFYLGNALGDGSLHGDVDLILGGEGNDQVGLQGYYRKSDGNPFLLGGGFSSIETIVLISGSDTRFGAGGKGAADYNLRLTAQASDAPQMLRINMNGLEPGEIAEVDGSAQTGSSYLFLGGRGLENLTGGADSDGFFFGRGAFGERDSVDGRGGADDQLGLQGSYTVTLTDTNMRGIETLVLLGSRDNRLGGGGTEPFQYDITRERIGFDADRALKVNANSLDADEHLRFDGTRNLGERYTVIGGQGADTIRGGTGADTILGGQGGDALFGGGGADTLDGGAGDDDLFGGMGRDRLTGGAGADSFLFTDAVSVSSGAARDLILDFDATVDRIGIARDADTHRGADLSGFTLSEGVFDSDLATALDGRLAVGEVIVATAGSGDLAGHVFVIADQNGVAGYQAGEDLVIEFANTPMLGTGLDWLVP